MQDVTKWVLRIRKTRRLPDEDVEICFPVLESIAKVDMPDSDALMAKMRSDCEE
jgi:hypothetical protein